MGYIYLLAVPKEQPSEVCQWADLRLKGSDWIRPHVQQGFAIRMTDPLQGHGNLDELQVATFVAPRPLLKLWASYEHLTSEFIYPNIGEDRGLEYWSNAAEQLSTDATFDDLVWCKPEVGGKSASVLAVLLTRGLPVSAEIRARIQACKDEATIARWIARARTAASAEDALDAIKASE